MPISALELGILTFKYTEFHQFLPIFFAVVVLHYTMTIDKDTRLPFFNG